jgi:hypothetical protein
MESIVEKTKKDSLHSTIAHVRKLRDAMAMSLVLETKHCREK